jgi:hypothetical protein
VGKSSTVGLQVKEKKKASELSISTVAGTQQKQMSR